MNLATLLTYGNSYELCIEEHMFCDGIPQCPDLSDESLEVCSDYLPKTDVICEAANIFNNKTILTRPILCNGIIECRDKSDEENCKANDNALTITLVIGLVILFTLAVLTVRSGNISEKNERGNMIDKLRANEELGKWFDFWPVVVVNQGTKQQKDMNCLLMQHLKKYHNYNFSLILQTLKVHDKQN